MKNKKLTFDSDTTQQTLKGKTKKFLERQLVDIYERACRPNGTPVSENTHDKLRKVAKRYERNLGFKLSYPYIVQGSEDGDKCYVETTGGQKVTTVAYSSGSSGDQCRHCLLTTVITDDTFKGNTQCTDIECLPANALMKEVKCASPLILNEAYAEAGPGVYIGSYISVYRVVTELTSGRKIEMSESELYEKTLKQDSSDAQLIQREEKKRTALSRFFRL